MKLLRHWKPVLTIALVFAAGCVTGNIVTMVKLRHAFAQTVKTDNWTPAIMGMLQKKLNLTPAQQTGVKPLVDNSVLQFKTAFGQMISKSKDIVSQFNTRLDQELTPEQKAINKQMLEQFRAGMDTNLATEQ